MLKSLNAIGSSVQPSLEFAHKKRKAPETFRGVRP